MKRARLKTKADETPEFQAFWNLWQPHARHTDGRGAARNEFFRHVEVLGSDPQDIVDGAAWFIRSLTERDREFIPLAASWLNRGAYEDMCEKERAFKARLAEKQEPQNVVRFQPGQTAFLKAFNAKKAQEA